MIHAGKYTIHGFSGGKADISDTLLEEIVKPWAKLPFTKLTSHLGKRKDIFKSAGW